MNFQMTIIHCIVARKPYQGQTFQPTLY